MTIASAVLYALASGALQAAPLAPVPAQDSTPDPSQQEEEAVSIGGVSADAYDLGEIVVSNARPRGSVQGDIEPDIVLDSEQLKAYGAGNIGELLAALEPLTRSSRGRSDAGPVLLLNGRRISGMREIASIPFEAIERTEILPEEVALTYGYSADQRVVNFVLKPAFRQVTASIDGRAPMRGGRTTAGGETNFFRIQDGDRWNLEVEYEHDTALFESERDIVRSPGDTPYDLIGNIAGAPFGTEIDPALSALAGRPVTLAPVPVGPFSPGRAAPGLADFAAGAGPARTGDLTAYRTLLPRTNESQVEGSVSRDLNATTKGTLSFGLEDSSSMSFLGLPGLALTLPGANPYSPFADDVLLYRYVDAPQVMTRDTDTLTGELGLLLDGFLGDDWRWTLSGAYDRVETESRTGRGFDPSALQAGLDAGDPAVNPFGALPLDRLASLADTAKSVSSGGEVEVVLTGNLWEGPAGDLQSTFKAGLDTRSLESGSLRSGVFLDNALSRDRGYGTANFNLPIADRDRGVLPLLGDLSVNFNAGYDQVSDFGGLTSVGLGANWSPAEPVSFVVSYTDEHGAPTIQQLNDPVITTPNVPVFDFATGQTVNVTQVDGGNADLRSDNRQVLKLGVNLQPFNEQELRFSSNYTWSRTDDAIISFPTITPDLEAALPERFTRDASGQLLSIDARPLNFARAERQDLRTGFNFSRAFGKPTPTPDAAPGGPGGGPGGRAGGRAMVITTGGPGGGGARSQRGRGMQPGQGHFNMSIYHTWRFQDEILIRDGLPILDQLDGAATGGRGGTPRQEVQVQAGVFRNGVGAFLNGNWRDGTRIDGGPDGSDLTFSDQATVNLTLFADLSSRASWVERFPWLKGARVNLGVDNLFDSRLDVRSSGSDLPLNYQPDYLDPQGRVLRVNLRKVLF